MGLSHTVPWVPPPAAFTTSGPQTLASLCPVTAAFQNILRGRGQNSHRVGTEHVFPAWPKSGDVLATKGGDGGPSCLPSWSSIMSDGLCN